MESSTREETNGPRGVPFELPETGAKEIEDRAKPRPLVKPGRAKRCMIVVAKRQCSRGRQTIEPIVWHKIPIPTLFAASYVSVQRAVEYCARNEEGSVGGKGILRAPNEHQKPAVEYSVQGCRRR